METRGIISQAERREDGASGLSQMVFYGHWVCAVLESSVGSVVRA